MTVGHRFGDQLARYGAAGARTVIDHDGLTPLFGEWLAYHARNDIDARTGRKRREYADRFGGISLGKCRLR